MYFFPYHTMDFNFVKKKRCGKISGIGVSEGLAVGALVHGGVCLVGTNQDAFQGAEVCILAVMGALCNGAFNALVCMAVHEFDLLFF